MRIEFMYDVPEKIDFGDVDILCDYKGNMKELIIQLFSPIEIFVNSNILSFAYEHKSKYYQIDLIQTTNFESYKFYFSYGDLGNILGKITKQYDIHFGIQGLFIDIFVDKPNKVVLSVDPVQICEYLGLDYSKWSNFHTVEEIFDWIISCKLFTPIVFDTLNTKDRRHIIDRKMFQDFLKYIETIDETKYKTMPIYSLKDHAIAYFHKEDEIERIHKEYLLLQQRKEKFNSAIFIKHGYSNKKLGEMIKNFKSQFIDFDEWLDNHTKEYIENSIETYLQNV